MGRRCAKLWRHRGCSVQNSHVAGHGGSPLGGSEWAEIREAKARWLGSCMSVRLGFLLEQGSSMWGVLSLRRPLAMSGDSFHCYSLERGATGIQWGEVKGATPHPIGTGHLQGWLLGLQGPDEKMAFDLIDTDLSSL